MNITSFKLVKNGFGGIEISGYEYFSAKDGKAVVDDIKGRKRKIPLSPILINDIQKLRYAFLNLTGHWIKAYNDFMIGTIEPMPLEEDSIAPHQYLKSLWDRAKILEVSIDADGFKIKGEIRIAEEKSITITTPAINANDDFTFFHDTMVLLDDIVGQINDYFKSGKNQLEDAKQYLLELFEDNNKVKDELEEKTDDELSEMYQDHLEKAGAIILMPPSGADAIGESQTEILENKNGLSEKKEDLDDSEDVSNENGPHDDIDKETDIKELSQENIDSKKEINSESGPSLDNEKIDDSDLPEPGPDNIDNDDSNENDLSNKEYSENMNDSDQGASLE